MEKKLVRALRDFDFEGITAAKGQILEVTPVQASMLGRAHHVNLSEHISKPNPEPIAYQHVTVSDAGAKVIERMQLVEEPVVVVQEPKPKRTYRRRDKRAEP